MSRNQVWIKNQSFQGFGCSDCNWMFKPSIAFVGETLDEVKQKYQAQLDKEYAAHVCGKHPRAESAKSG